jgi:hypothetical protein
MRTLRCILVVLAVAILLATAMSVATAAVDDWMTRPGTINHAMAQPDGTHVYLDAVRIDKNKPNQRISYFVVDECFGRSNRIIVLAALPAGFRLDQTIDIEGTLGTSRNGHRVILHPTIYAYLSRQGQVLYHGPLIKGLLEPTHWEWKQAFAAAPSMDPSAVQSTTTSSMALSEGDAEPPLDPSPAPMDPSVAVATIAAAKQQPDGTAVVLECKPVDSQAADHFVMAEDDTSDTLKVFYTGTLTTTHRINRIHGTMKTYNSERILCVNQGPGGTGTTVFDPAVDRMGGVMAAASGTIAWAMTYPDGTVLPTDGRTCALPGKQVSWCDGSVINIQESNGYMGIIVGTDKLPPDDSNYAADINGTIYTNNYGERFISGSVSYTATGKAVKPVGMNGRSIGGGDFNGYTRSSTDGVGIYNVGTLVRVWGRVTESDSYYGYFYLDDGSGRTDGTIGGSGQPNVGMLVICYHTAVPAVGSYAIVNGVVGKFSDGITESMAVWVYSPLDMQFDGAPTPTDLTATGRNGEVALNWKPVVGGMTAVYRSTSETGVYTQIGSGVEAYIDTNVTNGVTYWYKVAAAGVSSNGPQSTAVSATPDASAPIVAITTMDIDSEGVMTLSASGAAGTGGGTPVAYGLYVDDEHIWDFTPSEIASIRYDTTQLKNGTHKLSLRALGTTSTGIAAVAEDVQNFMCSNYISEFYVPDSVDGLDPIKATFNGPTDWTLSMIEGSSTVMSTSGSGTTMEVLWNAPSAGPFTIALSCQPSSDGGMSTARVNIGRNVTTTAAKISASRPPYIWSAVYCKDKDFFTGGYFENDWNRAQRSLFYKIGYTLDGYSMQVRNHSDWRDQIADFILCGDPFWGMPADIFYFRGHGNVMGASPRNAAWQGVITWDVTGSFASGLSSFVPITGPNIDIPSIGDALGNNARWDMTSGRLLVWNRSRRLPFVYLAACFTGDNLLPLAFGISRMRNPSSDAAYIGFKGTVTNGQAQQFNDAFWNALDSGKTVAEAATAGYWATNRTIRYVLYGNPNKRIW